MLSQEQKQALFSRARDDEERQRLLAALRSDPKADAMRDLFELVARYALIGAAAYAVAFLVDWVVRHTLSHAALGKWAIAPSVVAFLATIIALNMSFDGPQGAHRRVLWETMAHRYGYPIVLLAGLLGGSYYRQYADAVSEAGMASRAAIVACSQTPACIELAKSY